MLEGMGMLSASTHDGEDESELKVKHSPDDQVILGRDDSRTKDDLVQGDSSPRELPGPDMLMHESGARTDPEAVGAYTDVSGSAAEDILEEVLATLITEVINVVRLASVRDTARAL